MKNLQPECWSIDQENKSILLITNGMTVEIPQEEFRTVIMLMGPFMDDTVAGAMKIALSQYGAKK